MNEVQTQPLSRPGDGFLAALGYLPDRHRLPEPVDVADAFFQAMFSHSELQGLATVFGSSFDLLDRAIATYVALQLSIGWVAGGLQVVAGLCCLRGTKPRLVWAASLINLANFPHGTVVAVLMMLALRRPELANGFAPRAIA